MNFYRSRACGAAMSLLITVVGGFVQQASAQDWRDTKTGQPIASGPMISLTTEERLQTGLEGTGHFRGVLPDPTDRNRAFDEKTGRNFFRDANCVWRDSATGQPIASGPMIPLTTEERLQTGLEGTGHFRGVLPDPTDRNRAFDEKTGRNFAREPCPAPTKTAETTPPPPVRTASRLGFDPPPASYFAAPIGMSSGTLGFDYAHFNPKSGSDGDQWGFTGSALFPLMHNVGIGINAGYDRVTSKFFDLDHWTAGASLVWQIGDVRFGPTYGFQSNSANGFSVDTHNYGGFGEYFATPWLTVGAKGGGFSSDPGSNGYYVGGRFTGYIMPNFALNGMIDHTHFNAFGGANETDYSINGEYLLGGNDIWWPPVSIYGGYTRSNFTPGSFHVDTFFVGIKLYTDGNGATTLVDRQRTGTLGWQTDFAPLSLRF